MLGALPDGWYTPLLFREESHPPGAAAMNDVTRILSAIDQGDPHAAEQLLPQVYDQLRQPAAPKLAHEPPGQTLDPTALVHEPVTSQMMHG